MSNQNPFFTEGDKHPTERVDGSMQPLDPYENDVNMKEEPGSFDGSGSPIKSEPFTKHPIFANGEKDSALNDRQPPNRKTAAELANPGYGRVSHHRDTNWSIKEIVILVRTAEAQVPWKETMKHLPKRTQLAAMSKSRELRLEGKIASSGRRLAGADVADTPPGVLWEILTEAGDAEDAFSYAKEPIIRDASSTDNKTHRAASAAGAALQPTGPKRVHKKLDHNWSYEEDFYLMRQWWHERRDDKDIAQDMSTKSTQMCSARRNFLVHRDFRGGSPQVLYRQVMAEKK